MSSPCIADEDRLIPEDLLAGTVEGEWVRVPLYSAGHRVSRVGHTSWCGAQLIVDEMWYEGFQTWLIEWSGHKIKAKGETKWTPTEWYIALDRRKGDKCTQCKVDMMEEEEAPAPIPVVGDTSPFGEPTPAEQLERQRFLAKVAMVTRELGAELVA